MMSDKRLVEIRAVTWRGWIDDNAALAEATLDLLAEVDRLRAALGEAERDCDQLNTLADAWMRQAFEAQTALARVTAQHFPVDGVYADAPTVCGNRYCNDDATDQFAWPCPTMRAINGD